ncbi:MAG: ferric reductase-like transmembrane domain-containing protein [Roseiflexaceae bacterium]
MTTPQEKAERLAAIRAANAAKQPQSPPAGPNLPAENAPTRATAGLLATTEYADLPTTVSLGSLILMVLAATIGALSAVIVLPQLLPGLSQSLLGSEPKAYWYLSRSSAFVAYILMWLSVVFGLLMTNKLARMWPGGPTAFDLHQHTSLLSLAFALFHALILMGDTYIQASLANILIPFAYEGYQPLWVGIGQVGLYLLALIGLSFYAKPWIGRSAWRAIHFLSFVLFLIALAHGLYSGSDSESTFAQIVYWGSAASTLFLTIYRVLVTQNPPPKPQRANARAE